MGLTRRCWGWTRRCWGFPGCGTAAVSGAVVNVTLLTAEIQVERTTHPDRIQERLEGRGRRRIAPRPPTTPEEMPGRKPTPHSAQRHGPAVLDLWFAARRGGGRCRLSFFPPPPPRPAGRDGSVRGRQATGPPGTWARVPPFGRRVVRTAA